MVPLMKQSVKLPILADFRGSPIFPRRVTGRKTTREMSIYHPSNTKKTCPHAPIKSERPNSSDIAALASAYNQLPASARAALHRLLHREDPRQAQHHRNFRFAA